MTQQFNRNKNVCIYGYNFINNEQISHCARAKVKGPSRAHLDFELSVR